MRSSVAISGCLRELKRFIGNYSMKIKGKTNWKVARDFNQDGRHSPIVHVVAQFGILSRRCVGTLYVRFLIQLLRNFLEKFSAFYIFSATFVFAVTRKALEEFCVWRELLARVIELNNEILFPWWPCTIESRAPIHRITSKHEVNQVGRKKKINLCDFIAP